MKLLALGVGLLVTLAPPLSFFFLCWGEEMTLADHRARDLSRLVSQSVRGNPELWKYGALKYVQGPAVPEARESLNIRIYDEDGRLIEASPPREALFVRTGVSPITYNNQIYGRVEIDLDSEVATHSAVLALVFGLIGTCVGLGLFHYPTLLVREAKQKHDLLIEGLQKDLDEARSRKDELDSILADREALLQEIHHRVKNNLQIITSLINLRLRRQDNEEVRSILGNIKSKVMVMAQVHDHLYQSNDLALVAMEPYLQSIVGGYGQDFSASGALLVYRVSAPEVYLNLESALSVGLIVSELVMNSQKHAFVGRERGTISVSMERTGPVQVSLVVADDGIGPTAPPPESGDAPRALGMKLVSALASRMSAVPRITGPGYRVELDLTEFGPNRPFDPGVTGDPRP